MILVICFDVQLKVGGLRSTAAPNSRLVMAASGRVSQSEHAVLMHFPLCANDIYSHVVLNVQRYRKTCGLSRCGVSPVAIFVATIPGVSNVFFC